MPSQVADAGIEEGTEQVLLKSSTGTVAFQVSNGDGASEQMLREEEQPAVLETLAERRARRRSHYVVYLTTFVMSIGFSIVLTGVWPYLQQLDPRTPKEYLGWVVAANPLGQMLASPVLGLWGNKAKSNRGCFLLSLGVFTIGNGLYAILSAFGSAALPVMIFSRFLVGVSSANMAIVRSYISTSTTVKERTTAVALTSAAQGLGFIIGPALQTALALGFPHETSNSSNTTLSSGVLTEEVEKEESVIELNMYSATGWIGVLLGVTNFFLFFPCIYQEHPIAAKEALLQRRLNKDESTDIPKPDYVSLGGVLMSFFLFLFIYVLIETLIVPMCIDLYAWTDEKAIAIVGIGLSIAGALSVIMFVLTSVLTRRFDERKVFIFLGLVPMLLSMFTLFPMGSTYPKIRNCSIDSPMHNEGFSNPTTFAPELLDISSTNIPGKQDLVDSERKLSTALRLGVNIINKEKAYPAPLSEEVTPINIEFEPSATIVGGAETLTTTPREVNIDKVVEAFTVLPTEISTLEEEEPSRIVPDAVIFGNSEERTLIRTRRHVVQRGSCNDLGCPAEQEWCLYTPIVEIPQLGIGIFIAVIGYPVAFTLSSSLFSKLLGPKPQGVWMGVLTSTGSLSRVTGPIFVSYMYTQLGTRWTFGVLFVLMCIILVETCCLYKRLVPMKIARSTSR